MQVASARRPGTKEPGPASSDRSDAVPAIVLTADASQAHVRRCLESLRAQTIHVEPVVYESGGSEFNFSRSLNRARARIPPGRDFLLVNDDCYLEPAAAEALLEVLRSRPEVGLVGGLVQMQGGPVYSGGRVLRARLSTLLAWGLRHAAPFYALRRWRGDLQGHSLFIEFWTGPRPRGPVHFVPGSLCLFRASVFDALGGYDDAYPLFFGDTDYGLRVLETGSRIGVARKARAFHEGSKTLKRLGVRESALVRDARVFEGRWPLERFGRVERVRPVVP